MEGIYRGRTEHNIGQGTLCPRSGRMEGKGMKSPKNKFYKVWVP